MEKRKRHVVWAHRTRQGKPCTTHGKTRLEAHGISVLTKHAISHVHRIWKWVRCFAQRALLQSKNNCKMAPITKAVTHMHRTCASADHRLAMLAAHVLAQSFTHASGIVVLQPPMHHQLHRPCGHTRYGTALPLADHAQHGTTASAGKSTTQHCLCRPQKAEHCHSDTRQNYTYATLQYNYCTRAGKNPL